MAAAAGSTCPAAGDSLAVGDSPAGDNPAVVDTLLGLDSRVVVVGRSSLVLVVGRGRRL